MDLLELFPVIIMYNLQTNNCTNSWPLDIHVRYLIDCSVSGNFSLLHFFVIRVFQSIASLARIIAVCELV